MKMLAAVILLALPLIFTLPTPSAKSGDFGQTVTLPDDNVGETVDHKLHDSGTTMTVTGEYTLSGDISGMGSLTKAGTGTLTLSGDNTYSGGTVLEGGYLAIGNNNALGTGELTVSGDIQRLGIAFTGDYTLGNNIEMINADGTGSFSIDSGGYDVTITGAISESGQEHSALTKRGNGTLTLSGTTNYEGKTTVDGGTLKAGADDALDEGVYAINVGGTLDLNNHDLKMLGLEGDGGTILLGTANLTVGSDGYDPVDTSTVISGSGSFTKDGDSTLTLTADSTYTGTTTVKKGTLQIGNGA